MILPFVFSSSFHQEPENKDFFFLLLIKHSSLGMCQVSFSLHKIRALFQGGKVSAQQGVAPYSFLLLCEC